MGRYLVIGAATSIMASKEEAKKKYSSMDRFREDLLKRFNTNGIYDVEEDETQIRLTLKDGVCREEWLPFLATFFELRFGPRNSYWRDLEKELSKYDSLEKWVEVARETNAHYYHYDSLRWYPFNGEREWDATTVHTNIVGLSLDGKIGMEYYYEIFAFFTRLLRDRLSQFRLADSLLVHITE